MSVIGMNIKSRATGYNGVITGITKDKLSVSFRYSGIVELPIKKYEELLEMEPDRGVQRIRQKTEEEKRSDSGGRNSQWSLGRRRNSVSG